MTSPLPKTKNNIKKSKTPKGSKTSTPKKPKQTSPLAIIFKPDDGLIASTEIINSIPLIVWISDVSGKILCFNKRWHAFAGEQNLKAANLNTIVHPDDSRAFALFLKFRKTPSMLARFKAKNGKYRYFNVELTRLHGSKDGSHWIGTAVDIHEQKIAEEALAAAKNSLEIRKAKDDALMESIGEAILATDIDERIVFANHSAEDMFGFKEKEMIGMLFSEVLTIHDKLGASFPTDEFLIPIVLKTGKKSTISDLYYTTAHKKKFPASVTTSPIVIDGHTVGTMSIFRNTKREAQIDKAKTEFVSLASHQLRTPLTAVKLFTEMLLSDQYGKWNPEQKDMLESIERSNEKMIKLVDNLLNVANMEAGRMWVEPVLLSPRECINSIVAEVRPLAISRQIDLEYKEHPKDYNEIGTDRHLLRQILNSIITNAVEYSRKNTKVLVQVIWDDEKECIISVQDHGIGIAKKAQREIFNRFFRAENAIKFKTESSGLGLYVCKMMVEALGGKITFKTSMQKGTTFFVHLPLKNQKLLAMAKAPKKLDADRERKLKVW